MARYLGLDCSTQSLTGVVIDDANRKIMSRQSVVFDGDLPEWRTVKGQLPNADPRVGVAPPLLWLAALDLLLERLAARLDLSTVHGLAVSGQQHGSVYLNESAPEILDRLAVDRRLAEQLDGALARDVAPIWTDSTTTEECAEIRCALSRSDRAETDGALIAAELTGSDVFERFTGPQIRRFAKTESDAFARTASIALVSSFLTSVLAGKIAPIDQGDGSGMNLMNISQRQWSQRALDATWPRLGERLPPVVDCAHVVGPVSSYFSRYGLDDCVVVVGSGDNPSSLVGVGAISPGDLVVSLGTSDTLFGVMADLEREPSGQGHVFVAPTGDYMTLLCFRNGSLAREAVRDRHGLDWDGFDEAIAASPPGNRGQGMIPWFEPEIVPRVNGPGKSGPHRFGGLDPSDATAECRAVVEGQAIAIFLHSRWMPSTPRVLRVTGGAARNQALLQILADVFDCPVESADSTDSAALGAALRAVHALSPGAAEWRDLVAGWTQQRARRVDPRPQYRQAYHDLTQRYAEAEQNVL